MALVRDKNTKPEMAVRRLVYRMGYRYRLHCGELPGKPDLTFSLRRKVIFVHGCFWHRHSGCPLTRNPKTRVDFWELKFRENVRRDVAAQDALARGSWDVLVVWECEVKAVDMLEEKLRKFLTPQSPTGVKGC